MTNYRPLPREEVIKAVERRSPCRIPLIMAKWWGEGFEEYHGDELDRFNIYPEDSVLCLIEPIDYGAMKLPWEMKLTGAHDMHYVLPDWSMLDEFIARLPDPQQDVQFEAAAARARWAEQHDRYFLFGWWRLFFERPWEIRGMMNLLTDYVRFPEMIHKLNDALCETYLVYLRYALNEIKFDGFWTSDDLGYQKQLFISPEMFRQFLKPYYTRMGDLLREHGIHWWLHSCGNNFGVMDDLAEAGVNVFHPVQKHTMDEKAVAKQFGNRLTFLCGFDVQQILFRSTPEEVRAEVRYLIDTFDGPEGGMCMAAGNGILPGTPLENIDAFLEEALVYGERKRAKSLHKG